MKKYLIQPGADSLRLSEGSSPGLRASEVRVRVKAASLNYRDILNRKYATEEVVPFSDGAGEVIEVGRNVTHLKVGDRVLGLFFPTWMAGEIDREIQNNARGGGDVDGMLAEEVVGIETGFVRIPDHLSYEEASTLPCAGLTAWHALFEHAQPAEAGQTILIQGTGGVSIFALQLAVAHGINTIVTSSSDEKLERVREMGATHTINYRTTPNWEEEVFVLTNRKGVDLVIEVGGAGTLEKSMKAVKFNGVISLIGVLSGLKGTVNPFMIVGKSLRVFGIYVGSRAMQQNFHRALKKYQIHPIVDRVFEFSEANDCYEYQKSGQHFGNVVVKVD